MSILGAVVRVRPERVDSVLPRLGLLPGLEVALDPRDGRLVLVIEDVEVGASLHEASATLERISGWPDVLSTSLVYEYSGPDTPPRSI